MQRLAAVILLTILAIYNANAQSLPATPRCGDAQKTDAEQCDDGNINNGDGCNAFCFIEVVPKLPEKAKRRALIGTLVSYPLLIAISPNVRADNNDVAIALLGLSSGFAPSLGHFYTKAYGRGVLTALPRYLLNGGVVVSIAFFSALNELSPLAPEQVGQAAGITSLFLLPSIALSVWDILDAPLSIPRMLKRGKYN